MSARKSKRKVFYLLTAVFSLLALLTVWVYTLVFAPAVISGNSDESVIYIKTHDDYTAVYAQLIDKGILKYPRAFDWISEAAGYPDKVRPGKYTLSSTMGNYDIVKLLRSGKQEEIKLVLRSHWQLGDLIRYVNKKLNIDSVKLNQIMNDTLALQGLGMDKEKLMIYFIPNTYNFYWNTDPLYFMSRMSKAYKNFWNEKRSGLAAQIPLRPDEVAILASIIDKESAKVDEMPTIAGVYINRLKSADKKLRADATVVFTHNGFGIIKRVKYGHIESTKDSPYNTYHHEGLPPGPICIPSQAAIDAVLNYRKHKYMFYCAKEDFSGYHNFAVTLEEHILNSKRFNLAQDRRGIK